MPVPGQTLSGVALRAIGLRPTAAISDLSANYSPFIMLIAMIYYLPLAVRKLILDACRIQAPVLQNTTLSTTFYSLNIHFINCHISASEVKVILLEDIMLLLDTITPYPILCSLLSYFVRAESTCHIDSFLEEKMKSFDKEVKAALLPDLDQTLDYRGLYGLSDQAIHPQRTSAGLNIPVRLRTLWAAGIQRVKSLCSNYRTVPLFPAYSRLRNVGRETVENYVYAVYGADYVPTPYDYRTTSTHTLLRHYFGTGQRIGGPLEMRQAWFFNDLKPRTYYCLGGDAFWAGIYIQQIANMFATILPSTNPDSRFDVTRIGPTNDEYYVFTYDYSSFTTSLAELKYFLFWLAEEMRGTPVLVLDVVQGIRAIDLGTLIHDYNTLVNTHQVFSTERFFPLLSRYIRQGRNGSLGVKGNIVWSMTLHGVSLSDLTGRPDADSCVGDDALGKIIAHLVELMMLCVNNLGEINSSKFSLLRHTEDITQRTAQQFKYLKRPLNLDWDGCPMLGVLDFFPDVAGALFESDGIHSSRSSDYDVLLRAATFASQWGRFLRIQRDSLDYTDDLSMVREEDLEILVGLIAEVYRKFKLPIEGGIPGSFTIPTLDGPRTIDKVLVPPAEMRVFESPWEEVLVERFRGSIITEPIWMGGDIAPPVDLYPGDRFRCTTLPLLNLLEDLGCVEKEIELQDVVFDEEYLKRYHERVIAGHKENHSGMLASYTVLSVPTWYMDVALYYHPETIPIDPIDALSRVTSLSLG